MEGLIREGRSLAETPTWSVATVTTVMVFMCLLVQRSLYKFGRWLKKTRRKALFASVEKIKEEMMLLGLISLLLGQWAGAISQICVDSSVFNSKFFTCSEEDYGIKEHIKLRNSLSLNETVIPSKDINHRSSQHCGEGREPFVSHEGLEQLHRFLFVLGITHVLYSCIAVGLAMTKIYSWRKWEVLASLTPDGSMQALFFQTVQKFDAEVGLLCTAIRFHHRGLTSCHYHTISISISSGVWKMNFMELWGSAGRSGVMP